jgi:peptidoglycan hydrolase-like protein with peptidoglycan-binding domain
MEALIVTSALLAIAKLLGKKSHKEEPASAPNQTPPMVVKDRPPPPPPPPPPREPPRTPPGAPDAARLERARALALQAAQLIKAQGPAYNRELVAAFQREAGLVSDGIYGPRTAGALKWYTGESISPMSGRGFEGYAPFGTVKASSAAPKVPSAPNASPVPPPKQGAQQTKPPQSTRPQLPPSTPAIEQKPKVQPTAPESTRPKVPEVQKPSAPSNESPVVSNAKPEPRREPPQTPTKPATVLPSTDTTKRLDRAAELAKQVAESVKARGQAYDRAVVRAFQQAADLTADGIYGPKTAGALKWYTGELVPPIGGGALAPYAPKLDAPGKSDPKPTPSKTPEPRPAPKTPEAKPTPTPTANSDGKAAPLPTAVVRDTARLDRAAALAKRVADNLKLPAASYDRALITEFQRAAGLKADGIYGPKSAGAIKWYTGESVSPKTGRGFTNYIPNF